MQIDDNTHSEPELSYGQECAKYLEGRGFALTRLAPKAKRAIVPEWANNPIPWSEFQPSDNVGILPGVPSGNMIDIDCDVPEAAPLVRALIHTNFVFGRDGKPGSHLIVRIMNGETITRITFKDPDTGDMLGELRGDGTCTMAPGSMHPNGELIRFELAGEPAVYPAAELELRMALAMLGALVVRCYPNLGDQKHELWKAIGGYLAKGGVPRELAETLVRKAPALAIDPEQVDRLRAVLDSYIAHEDGREVIGITGIQDILGAKRAREISKWFGFKTQNKGEPEYTDIGNARAFVDRHGDSVHYCPALGGWLVWDGKRWRSDTANKVQEFAAETVQAMYYRAGQSPVNKDLAKHALKSMSAPRIAGMLRLASSDPRIVAEISDFDWDPFAFNVLNGTLNLRTGGIHPHERSEKITKLAPVTYEPRATSDLWESTLARVLPDKAVLDFVKRFIGLSLTGDVSEKTAALFYGTTDTGKSTVVETIQALLGPDYCKVMAEDALMDQKQGNGHPTEIARLQGARLVTLSETADGARIKAARFKALTGRNRQTARFMRQDAFEFDPEFKLLIETNYRPHIPDGDEAVWRRLKLVGFNVQIPEAEQVKGLREALRSQLPGILNWAVEGCLDWQLRDGLDAPEAVLAATAEYRADESPLRDFIEERCVIEPDAKATVAHIYAAYEAFCTDSGIRFPLTKRGLVKQLEVTESGVTSGKGNRNIAVLRGIGVKPGILRAEPIPMPDGVNPFAQAQT